MNADQESGIEGFPHRFVQAIRFRDLDPYEHVNNAVYSSYLEAARIDVIMSESILSPGCGIVIARLVIDFRRELKWPGEITIGTRFARLGSASMNLEQVIMQNGITAAESESVIVHIDRATGRPTRLGDDARTRIASQITG